MMFFATSVIAAERPTIQFDGRTYTLAQFVKYSTSVHESYIPEGQNWSNYDSIITRVELFDVNSTQNAANGFAFDYQDMSLPHKFAKNTFSDEKVLMGTFYSIVHPVVFDKEIAIFKKLPNTHRVVYYSFVKREFNVDKKTSISEPMTLLLDDSYIEKMVNLKID